IPKPVKAPDAGESPGTGQDAPEDPDEPELIEPPEELACVEDEDEEDCDPEYPGEGKHPGNKPGPAWYDDMAYRMYEMQESLEGMEEWSSKYDHPYINYYARWMKSVMQQYYALAYYDGKPREYSYGKMTRGAYNYYYYYW